MSKPRAYVTLLTNNSFMPALIAMLDSFRLAKSAYGMAVMVTPDVSGANKAIISGYFGAEVIDVDPVTLGFGVSYKGMERPNGPSYHTCLTKLRIFGLTQFDKVVYVDADMVFLQNADELFDLPHMSAVKDPAADWNYLNAGLLVVKPSEALFNRLQAHIREFTEDNYIDLGKKYYDRFWGQIDDQIILRMEFPDWVERTSLHIGNSYNKQLNYWALEHLTLQEWKDLKILHMSCPERPWNWVGKSIQDYFAALMKWLSIMNIGVYSTWAFNINRVIEELQYAGYESEDLPLLPMFR